MIVVLSAKQDATTQYLCSLMQNGGKEFLRVDFDDTDSLQSGFDLLAGGILDPASVSLNASQITGIWYRRPFARSETSGTATGEERFLSREWLEVFKDILHPVPASHWLNFPLSEYTASARILQYRLAKQADIGVPLWAICSNGSQAKPILSQFGGSAVMKPITHGLIEATEEKDRVVFAERIGMEDIDGDARWSSPVLLQKEIRPKIDIRVNVCDQHIFATTWTTVTKTTRVDIRAHTTAFDYAYEKLPLPEGLTEKVIALMHFLNLRFATMDFALDESGTWWLLDVNPAGNWAWLDSVFDGELSKTIISALSK